MTLNHAMQTWAEKLARGIEDSRQEHVVAFSVNHGNHNTHMNILTHQEATQTQDWSQTSAEIQTQLTQRPFGATPTTITLDGTIVTHSTPALKYAQALAALTTEDGRHIQELATNANHGQPRNLTGTQTHLQRNQMLDWMETTAETQMENQRFGATPWTHR
jgi:hypothetical protein